MLNLRYLCNLKVVDIFIFRIIYIYIYLQKGIYLRCEKDSEEHKCVKYGENRGVKRKANQSEEEGIVTERLPLEKRET